MIKLILLLLLAYIPIRPPVPVVPFAYDPNQCTEILGWKELDPNSVYPFTVRVTEPDGQDVMFQIIMSAGVVDVNAVPNTTVDPNDPDGVSRIYTYQCSLAVSTVGVYYGWLRTEDPNGLFDIRTLLFNVRVPPKVNHPPVLSGWSG